MSSSSDRSNVTIQALGIGAVAAVLGSVFLLRQNWKKLKNSDPSKSNKDSSDSWFTILWKLNDPASVCNSLVKTVIGHLRLAK